MNKRFALLLGTVGLFAIAAMAYSPSPSSNVSSEELGAVGTTNGLLSPVPRGHGRDHVPPQQKRAERLATPKVPTAAPRLTPHDPNIHSSSTQPSVIVPPRRHHSQ